MMMWIGIVLACITTNAQGEAPERALDPEVVRIAPDPRAPMYTF